MSFDPKLITFPGRILDPEKIIIGNNVSVDVDPMTADFTRSLTDLNGRKSLLDTGVLRDWAVVYPRKFAQNEVFEFCKILANAAKTLGFPIPKPHFEAINDDRPATYVNAIEMICQSNNPLLVMTILPNNRQDRYDAIKKKCYVQRSVPNQVVLAKNMSKKNMSVCTKIAIQMCCKIGGSPWSVNIPFKTPTMVVGFDVCHDKALSQTSVGALVASLNPSYTRYYSSVTFHKNGSELCDFLAAEFMKCLVAYRNNNNGLLPTRIFFYRDSVGEGNYHYTLEVEVAKIVAMWKLTYPEAGECPLTYIIVSKGINCQDFS
ncbi:hypothetical protein GE061_011911 [Apolygus lucorum]|uniref:Piwi domain-containing protein n=1 Tax=Apolygus lucorum TaxID=248454 RepID=A0A8S9XS55_APOLU|nr:hypothetical protein GE061_011911 [Apolygus lucorum]